MWRLIILLLLAANSVWAQRTSPQQTIVPVIPAWTFAVTQTGNFPTDWTIDYGSSEALSTYYYLYYWKQDGSHGNTWWGPATTTILTSTHIDAGIAHGDWFGVTINNPISSGAQVYSIVIP